MEADSSTLIHNSYILLAKNDESCFGFMKYIKMNFMIF